MQLNISNEEKLAIVKKHMCNDEHLDTKGKFAKYVNTDELYLDYANLMCDIILYLLIFYNNEDIKYKIDHLTGRMITVNKEKFIAYVSKNKLIRVTFNEIRKHIKFITNISTLKYNEKIKNPEKSINTKIRQSILRCHVKNDVRDALDGILIADLSDIVSSYVY